MDRVLISVFDKDEAVPELYQSMRDITYLAGVFNDLGTHQWLTPAGILRFLRIIQLLNEESLGLAEPIENTDTLFYRYRNKYTDPNPPSQKQMEQMINILVKYNWLSKQSRQIKLRDAGKRMMDALVRLANDSVAYYMHDEIGRSLFQARRDAEISEAYDDHGISGGNKIASMIRNVDNAIQLLKERELEMLADRNALPQLELIHGLMEELQGKLEERYRQFQTLEDSLVLTTLMQKGTSVLAEGTSLSLGMTNKYLKFATMRETVLSSYIQPEKVREFITKMYDPPVDSDIPNPYQMLSFMEQDQYEDEALDGLWIPVKFAAPISAADISDSVHYLENYEPKVKPLEEEEEMIEYRLEQISADELQQYIGDTIWMMTKSMIRTEEVEQYLDQYDEAGIAQIMIEAAGPRWSDAINSLTAISALIGNDKVWMNKALSELQKWPDKVWEWIEPKDQEWTIKKRKPGDLSDEP
nr:hypothetical protein [Paenibacillus dokdonensis]